MKTAAKVFIWIGMILQFFLIYPIVIGIFALKKLDNPSSSSDLQTWGLLTVFFCSPIGGILMLSVKDSIPAANYYQQPTHMPVTTQRTVVTKNYLDPNDKKRFWTRIKIIILMALHTCLLAFSFGFTCVLLDSQFKGGVLLIPLTISCLQAIATIIFFFAITKKHLVKNINFWLVAILVLTVLQIIFSALLNYYGLYNYKYDYHYKGYFKVPVHGECWFLWSIFGINCGALPFILISLILSIKTKQSTLNYNPKTKTVVTTNHMEIELAEAKRLLDTNVITQEEHDRIRSSIISKYHF